jgi:hypothetical protein
VSHTCPATTSFIESLLCSLNLVNRVVDKEFVFHHVIDSLVELPEKQNCNYHKCSEGEVPGVKGCTIWLSQGSFSENETPQWK